jgi:type II secretory pathway component GspD/PulD (secretin)
MRLSVRMRALLGILTFMVLLSSVFSPQYLFAADLDRFEKPITDEVILERTPEEALKEATKAAAQKKTPPAANSAAEPSPIEPRRPASSGEAQGIDIAPREFAALTYYVAKQSLPAVLNELTYLSNFKLQVDGSFEQEVTNMMLKGPLDQILDQLSKRHNFVWSLENDVIEIAPLKSQISRSLKVGTLTEGRIAELLAAAGISINKDQISFDESTNILRLRGSPRFVAKAEAAIRIGAPQAAQGGDQVHVIRAGRIYRVVE